MVLKRARLFLLIGVGWSFALFGCSSSGKAVPVPVVAKSAVVKATIQSSPSWSVVDAGLVKWRLGLLTARVPGAGPVLEWSAASADLSFEGTGLRVDVRDLADSRWTECRDNMLEVVVDGQDTLDHVADNEKNPVLEIGHLKDGRHTLHISKRTEALCGRVELGKVAVLGGQILSPPPEAEHKILYIGGSVTCGWGVMDRNPDPDFRPGSQSGTASYAAEAAKRLGADYASVCVSGRGLLWNWDKKSADILPKVWRKGTLQEAKCAKEIAPPDAVVLELGHVELQDGNPEAATFTRAYVEFVMEIHQKWPKAWIVGVDVPALDEDRLADLRGFMIPADQWIRGRYRVKNFSHLFLTQQGSLGYGGGGFPNREQSMMNGEELADHLRSHLGWRVAQK